MFVHCTRKPGITAKNENTYLLFFSLPLFPPNGNKTFFFFQSLYTPYIMHVISQVLIQGQTFAYPIFRFFAISLNCIYIYIVHIISSVFSNVHQKQLDVFSVTVFLRNCFNGTKIRSSPYTKRTYEGTSDKHFIRLFPDILYNHLSKIYL